MNYAVFNVPGQAETVQAIDDEDVGLPKPCTPTSPGIHAPIHPTIPGEGWVLHQYGVRTHPTIPNRQAYPVRHELPGLAAGRIPAQALQALQNAAPLDPDWTPPGLASANQKPSKKEPIP